MYIDEHRSDVPSLEMIVFLSSFSYLDSCWFPKHLFYFTLSLYSSCNIFFFFSQRHSLMMMKLWFLVCIGIQITSSVSFQLSYGLVWFDLRLLFFFSLFHLINFSRKRIEQWGGKQKKESKCNELKGTIGVNHWHSTYQLNDASWEYTYVNELIGDNIPNI